MIYYKLNFIFLFRFEKNNNISINVFTFDEHLAPLQITTNKSAPKHVNLLLLENKHYVWIKDINRLIFTANKHEQRKFLCNYCLQYQQSEVVHKQHVEDCVTYGPQKVSYSTKSHMEFENVQNMMKAPIVIYADFESMIVDDKHKAIAYGYYLKSCIPSVPSSTSVITYFGEDAAVKFVQEMKQVSIDVKAALKTNISMIAPLYQTPTECHLCQKPFESIHDAVRNHCHQTGQFLGFAHNKCNLNYKYRKQNGNFLIPVVFHNLRGYDAHLIIPAIEKNTQVDVIAKNLESYLAIKIGSLRIIDSLQFLSSSLDKLVSITDRFPIMESLFNDPDLLKKGVYPYEYMNSVQRYDETDLPPIKDFYSSLSGTTISVDEHEWAKKMWQKYGCSNLRDYTMLYLSTDVALLADVFENFRSIALEQYQLDPCHYVFLPSFSWDAMLKMTGVKLQLLSDPEMHLMIEKGIRGGFSAIVHRFAEANNPLMSTYDEKKPTSYISYLDANNLYGWAMSQKLPIDNFKWVRLTNLTII